MHYVNSNANKKMHCDILDIILQKNDIGNNISNWGEIFAQKNETVE